MNWLPVDNALTKYLGSVWTPYFGKIEGQGYCLYYNKY